ncbi:hypothetical protein WN944_029219 [Citrus x changshan-huyou]|uniref:Secreted protein n=1 Tax=Citrus x changshan-huyou TaxID=2935761 RepID=A0AAP0QA52_9ROSI
MAISKNAVIFSVMVMAICCGGHHGSNCSSMAMIAPTPQEASEETYDLPTIDNVERQKAVLIPGDADSDSAPTGARVVKNFQTAPKKTQTMQEEADCDFAPAGARTTKPRDLFVVKIGNALKKVVKLVRTIEKYVKRGACELWHALAHSHDSFQVSKHIL